MTRPWWHEGVIYQIYPRSFQDSNGDGIGDLAGIETRLDALVALGVDAIWISPIFPSPMADFGYDVADYTGIDPRFGTMEAFDRLLAAAHARGLKLLLDFVPNHSSDQHAWFEESRASRDNPKRDWYLWRDPAPDGGVPNNWMSHFGGPAWTFDEATGQYYYHAFLKEQPDLNWRNPDTAQAMLDAMRFWFNKGVDGFRIDVLWLVIKDPDFTDNPVNPAWHPGMQDLQRVLPYNSADQPGVRDVVHAMRRVADDTGGLLIGEIYLPIDRLVAYYGEDGRGVQLPFNFLLLDTPWNASAIRHAISEYEAALPEGGWPNWVLGNHDKPRVAARVGEAQARVAAMLLLTLRGTPTLYQGDELGLAGAPVPPERIRDPQKLREPTAAFNRDEARLPMPWDGSAEGGFTSGDPWLPLQPDFAERNVAAQTDAPGSMWTLHRDLLALRRAHSALTLGSIELIAAADDVIAYVREHEGERLFVALNLSGGERPLHVPAWATRVLMSTLDMPAGVPDRLRADEGVVVGAAPG